MGSWRRVEKITKVPKNSINPQDSGWIDKDDCIYYRRVVPSTIYHNNDICNPLSVTDPTTPTDCCCYCVTVWTRRCLDPSSSSSSSSSSSEVSSSSSSSATSSSSSSSSPASSSSSSSSSSNPLSSSSSSSSTSSSSSSSSSCELQNWVRYFETTYDCDTQTWSTPTIYMTVPVFIYPLQEWGCERPELYPCAYQFPVAQSDGSVENMTCEVPPIIIDPPPITSQIIGAPPECCPSSSSSSSSSNYSSSSSSATSSSSSSSSIQVYAKAWRVDYNCINNTWGVPYVIGGTPETPCGAFPHNLWEPCALSVRGCWDYPTYNPPTAPTTCTPTC